MLSTPTDQPAALPLQAAVDAVTMAVEQLIKLVDDGGLSGLGAFGLVEFLQSYETVKNTMAVVDRAAIQYGSEQGAPSALSQRSMTGVLMSGLRLSAGEAARRVKAAEHLADRHSQLGDPLPPIRGHLAQAQRDGLVSPEQVALIDGALRKVRHCDAAAVEAGEVLLVQQASQLGYKDLTTVAAKLVEAIDPDGILPSDEAEHRLRRFFHLKQRTDGCWVGDFRLTPAVGQKLAGLLGPLMNPRTSTITPEDADGVPGRKQVLADERTQGQRRHDALEEILDAALRSAERPETSNGTPATIIITMTWADFHGDGVGSYADQTPVSARTARNLAEQAAVAFCLTSAKGAVLDLYRSRRIASPAQTLALIARDKGCSFPGCQVEPGWCERHHVVAWWDGGDTNLGNLTLVCGFHHRQFVKQGWRCVINADGLPVWIPPRWIDSLQRPIINHRIMLGSWDPHQPLDLSPTLDLDYDGPPDPPD